MWVYGFRRPSCGATPACLKCRSCQTAVFCCVLVRRSLCIAGLLIEKIVFRLIGGSYDNANAADRFRNPWRRVRDISHPGKVRSPN